MNEKVTADYTCSLHYRVVIKETWLIFCVWSYRLGRDGAPRSCLLSGGSGLLQSAWSHAEDALLIKMSLIQFICVHLSLC